MQGTGIPEFPYTIMTADDLYLMDIFGGEDKYFRLGADIDFNGTSVSESFRPIPLCCAQFDGCGHTIRNVYVNTDSEVSLFENTLSPTYLSETTVKNLRLSNISLTGKTVSLVTNGIKDEGAVTVHFANCVFPVKIKLLDEIVNPTAKNCDLLTGEKTTADVYGCTMAIDLISTLSFPVLSGGTAARSRFQVRYDLRKDLSSSMTGNALFYGSSFVDCYFFGTVSAESNLYDGRFCFAQNGSFNNCYQVIGYRNFTDVYWNSEIKSTCFYDSGLIGEGVTVRNTAETSSSPAVIHALTTEQCKDALYLQTIGFYCEGID